MTSEIEDAVARVEATLDAALSAEETFVVNDVSDLVDALTASQAEVERLRADVSQFVTCMCGQPIADGHHTSGHSPVSVAEHYYDQQYARAEAAEARATRAEGLLEEVEGVFLQAHDALEAARDKMRGAVEPDDREVFDKVNTALYAVRSRPDTTLARAFLDKLKGEG